MYAEFNYLLRGVAVTRQDEQKVMISRESSIPPHTVPVTAKVESKTQTSKVSAIGKTDYILHLYPQLLHLATASLFVLMLSLVEGMSKS